MNPETAAAEMETDIPAPGSEYDLEGEIKSLVGEDMASQKPNFSLSHLLKLKDTAAMVGVRLRSQNEARMALNKPKDWEDIKTLLWTFFNLEEITPEYRNSKASGGLNIKGVLELFTNPDHHYPAQYQAIARAIHENFTAQNWGETLPVEEPPAQDQDEGSSKRTRASSRAVSKPDSAGAKVWIRAADNHPIFGRNGIMHHIQVHTKARKTYRLDPGYLRPTKANVFGHNGFAVGQCFPLQIAALRDGAHGATQAGIYGTPELGVYSIIVSGSYEDVDFDKGDSLSYSTAGAQETTAPQVDYEKLSTKALLRSVEHGKSVRVLRSYTAKWNFAPRAGLRYDGLYRVVSYSEKENDKGGKYLQFHLEREGGQPPIQRNQPDDAQRVLFGRVFRGY